MTIIRRGVLGSPAHGTQYTYIQEIRRPLAVAGAVGGPSSQPEVYQPSVSTTTP